MLDHYFRRPCALTRLRAGPFTEQLVALSIYLHERGYARLAIRSYVRNAARFARWLAAKKLSLDAVDEHLLRSFLASRPPRPSRRPRGKRPCVRLGGLQHFLHVLRSRGDAPSTPAGQPGAGARLVAEYDCYLRDVCGLAPETRVYRTRYARAFLRATFGTRAICWEHVRPKHLRSFVAGFGRSGRIASGVVAASSLRSFLRWLVFQGQCPPSLIALVPRFHRCRYTGLPRVLTDPQLRSFLATFDRATPVGRRDYAMALCQAHLGLRVGEVQALTLDDIDWRNATVRIAGGKARRGRVLPLLASVGRAVAAYLRHGRPDTGCRHLFVRDTFPTGSPVSRAIIINAFARAFAKVPGCEGWRCTHVLRYTAATRMYRRGASLKAIADLLGHRGLDTTALYARVEPAGLAAIALPWPKEVQP